MTAYSKLQLLLFILIGLSVRFTKIGAANLNDLQLNKLELSPVNEKPKFIPTFQLEKVLLSIEGTSNTIVEKQKEDAISLSQVTTDIQLINQRLQNIENQMNQMEQAEIFNKHRFELFQDSYIKEGLQFDEMKRKAEKYYQQTNNRISEIDFSLEKVHNTQETILREIRKLSMSQTKLMNSMDEMSENLKMDWNKFQKSLNNSQQRFTEEMSGLFKTLTNFTTAAIDIPVLKLPATSPYETSTDYPKVNNDDGMASNWLGQIFNINAKFEATQEHIKTVKSSINKCISMNEHMNDEFRSQKLEFANLVSDTQKFIIDELRMKSNDDIDRLSSSFRTNFDILLKEQENFKNSCHIIQVHEERLEDKVIYVLDKLFNYIDNRTDGIRSDLDRLLQNEMKQGSDQTREIQKMKELLESQKSCGGKETTRKPSTVRPTESQSRRGKLNYPPTTSVYDKVMYDQPHEPESFEDELQDI